MVSPEYVQEMFIGQITKNAKEVTENIKQRIKGKVTREQLEREEQIFAKMEHHFKTFAENSKYGNILKQKDPKGYKLLNTTMKFGEKYLTEVKNEITNGEFKEKKLKRKLRVLQWSDNKLFNHAAKMVDKHNIWMSEGLDFLERKKSEKRREGDQSPYLFSESVFLGLTILQGLLILDVLTSIKGVFAMGEGIAFLPAFFLGGYLAILQKICIMKEIPSSVRNRAIAVRGLIEDIRNLHSPV